MQVASTRRSYEAVIERVGMESLSKVIPRAEIALSWFAFRWAAQTLDSRAIWWNGQRHLVHMLDLVNAADASEMPRTATVHKTSASLHRAEPTAVTPAAWKFESGDQLLEDYGQPNHVLFLPQPARTGGQYSSTLVLIVHMLIGTTVLRWNQTIMTVCASTCIWIMFQVRLSS